MVAVTALGAVLVGGLLWTEHRRHALRPAAKIAASAGFILVALLGGALDTGYGRWVLAALALSAVGDAALLSHSNRAFLAGLGAFLFGHVAYSVGFAVRGLAGVPLAAALAVLVVPAVAVIRWLLPAVPPALRGPVAGYATVITVMVGTAIATAIEDPGTWIAVAALAFYLSDLAVARDRFVSPGLHNKLWGLPLYYAAQYVFAWTV